MPQACPDLRYMLDLLREILERFERGRRLREVMRGVS